MGELYVQSVMMNLQFLHSDSEHSERTTVESHNEYQSNRVMNCNAAVKGRQAKLKDLTTRRVSSTSSVHLSVLYSQVL